MLEQITNSPLLSGIVNHVWQTTVFASVVAVIVFAMRRNHAHLRHAMWLAASVKFLVPFTLLVAIGNAIEWPASRPAFPQTAKVAILARPISPPTEIAPADSIAGLMWIVALAWTSGFLLVAFRWLRAWLRARRAVGSCRETTMSASPVLCGVTHHVAVRVSEEVKAPCVYGLVRPVLLLPAAPVMATVRLPAST